MRRVGIIGGIGIALGITVGVAGAHALQRSVNGQRLFTQVAQILNERFIDSIGSSALFEKAAQGLVGQLRDPYSELLPPRAVEDFERSVGGRYGGIGALVESRLGNRTFIQKIFPNTPAEQAGVAEGDEIVAVDTAATVGWEMGRVTERMRGVPGTPVKVTFRREGVREPIVLTLIRAVVRVPAVPYTLMLEPGIGYVPLQAFNETSADDARRAVEQLRQQGATGLILDLRGNTGGILDQALSITSLFLQPGQPIVTVRGRTGIMEADSAQGPRLASQLPLIVLTDERSASASEIVAGALQDHDRALVLGERTYGKGLVQQTFQLDGGYLLKVTTGKWYTPSGRSIHRERELRADGRFVEVQLDTLKTPLPRFRSDAGWTLVGGGGIVPDLTVLGDTLSAAEQEVLRAFAPNSGVINAVLLDEAVRHKASVAPNFTVNPAWVAEVNRKLDSVGVKPDPRLESARAQVLSRELGRRIARQAFGDSGAARRDVPLDRQLMRGVTLLRGKTTQSAVFVAAGTASR